MSHRKLEDGESLQVGDIIVHEHSMGRSRHVVFRITKKYAFVMYNDVAKGKYPNVYGLYFSPLPRTPYPTSTYEVYRKYEQEPAKNP